MQQETSKKKCPARQWVKRFGVGGLVFFLVKGLLWLLVPAVMYYLHG